jgi:hypothetical protein
MMFRNNIHVSLKVHEIGMTSQARTIPQHSTPAAILNKPSFSLLFEDISARVDLSVWMTTRSGIPLVISQKGM